MRSGRLASSVEVEEPTVRGADPPSFDTRARLQTPGVSRHPGVSPTGHVERHAARVWSLQTRDASADTGSVSSDTRARRVFRHESVSSQTRVNVSRHGWVSTDTRHVSVDTWCLKTRIGVCRHQVSEDTALCPETRVSLDTPTCLHTCYVSADARECQKTGGQPP